MIKRTYILIVIIVFWANNLFAQNKYIIDCNSKLPCKALQIAKTQVGVKEATNRNDGEVEKYLRAVGLSKGNPYCMAGIYWCFKKASGDTINICIPKTAVANKPYEFAKKNGIKVDYIAKKNNLIVWRTLGSWSGHIAIIRNVGKLGWITTIEFNTTSGLSGSQRDGGGVYIRKRNIYHPLGRMQVRGLIGFRK